MRDLQADLEYVTNPPSGDLEYWRKRSIAMPNIAKHAIKRAIKAEALVREFEEALGKCLKLADKEDDRFSESDSIELDNLFRFAFEAKEVLSDE